MNITEKDLARFWAKVALPDENGCMLWMASKHGDGYAQFRLGGQNIRAHRVALLWSAGPAPDGRPESAHSCRNRHCVAPAHLRWASKSENMRDRRRDGTAWEMRVEQDDERLGYVTVQVNRETWNELKAALSSYIELCRTTPVAVRR